jgi:hypothetical protein
MDLRAAIEHPARADARTLDRAEGVLIALRHCTTEAAFGEIVRASKRHRVPTLRMAAALVALAQDSPLDGDASAAARLRVGFAARAGTQMIDRVVVFAGWVRGRYPDWAPARGHIALVALCGREDPHSVSSERVTPS